MASAAHILSRSPLLFSTASVCDAFAADTFRRPSLSSTRLQRRSTSSTRGTPLQKPPTILVFTGDKPDVFERMRNALAGLIDIEAFSIVHLTCEAICTHPWLDASHICIIVTDTTMLDDRAWTKMNQYFASHAGKVLFICENRLLASLTRCDSQKKQSNLIHMAFGEQSAGILGKQFEQFLKRALKTIAKRNEVNATYHSKDVVGGYRYSVVISKKSDSPLLLYMEDATGGANAVFSDASLDDLLRGDARLVADAMRRLRVIDEHGARSNRPGQLQPGYLHLNQGHVVKGLHLGEQYTCRIARAPRLLFLAEGGAETLSTRADFVPIELRASTSSNPSANFDPAVFFAHLHTRRLGQALLFLPVCTSTMDIAQCLVSALPADDSLVVIAERQTNGSGRGGNQWLSPIGCAMFSFGLRIAMQSPLGQAPAFLQHILAIAVVQAVTSMPNMHDFPLRLKWPNDIYYARSFKLGGVLVNSSVLRDSFICVLGAGLNVANHKPTVCINDMLSAEMDKLRVEQVIARTLTAFEELVQVFQTGGGDEVLAEYYRFWLHSNEEVFLNDEHEAVTIRGLDENGFLQVRSRRTGRVFSVHPDGNTFDMMKNLIRVKT